MPPRKAKTPAKPAAAPPAKKNPPRTTRGASLMREESVEIGASANESQNEEATGVRRSTRATRSTRRQTTPAISERATPAPQTEDEGEKKTTRAKRTVATPRKAPASRAKKAAAPGNRRPPSAPINQKLTQEDPVPEEEEKPVPKSTRKRKATESVEPETEAEVATTKPKRTRKAAPAKEQTPEPAAAPTPAPKKTPGRPRKTAAPRTRRGTTQEPEAPVPEVAKEETQEAVPEKEEVAEKADEAPQTMDVEPEAEKAAQPVSVEPQAEEEAQPEIIKAAPEDEAPQAEVAESIAERELTPVVEVPALEEAAAAETEVTKTETKEEFAVEEEAQAAIEKKQESGYFSIESTQNDTAKDAHRPTLEEVPDEEDPTSTTEHVEAVKEAAKQATPQPRSAEESAEAEETAVAKDADVSMVPVAEEPETPEAEVHEETQVQVTETVVEVEHVVVKSARATQTPDADAVAEVESPAPESSGTSDGQAAEEPATSNDEDTDAKGDSTMVDSEPAGAVNDDSTALEDTEVNAKADNALTSEEPAASDNTGDRAKTPSFEQPRTPVRTPSAARISTPRTVFGKVGRAIASPFGAIRSVGRLFGSAPPKADMPLADKPEEGTPVKKTPFKSAPDLKSSVKEAAEDAPGSPTENASPVKDVRRLFGSHMSEFGDEDVSMGDSSNRSTGGSPFASPQVPGSAGKKRKYAERDVALDESPTKSPAASIASTQEENEGPVTGRSFGGWGSFNFNFNPTSMFRSQPAKPRGGKKPISARPDAFLGRKILKSNKRSKPSEEEHEGPALKRFRPATDDNDNNNDDSAAAPQPNIPSTIPDNASNGVGVSSQNSVHTAQETTTTTTAAENHVESPVVEEDVKMQDAGDAKLEEEEEVVDSGGDDSAKENMMDEKVEENTKKAAEHNIEEQTPQEVQGEVEEKADEKISGTSAGVTDSTSDEVPDEGTAEQKALEEIANEEVAASEAPAETGVSMEAQTENVQTEAFEEAISSPSDKGQADMAGQQEPKDNDTTELIQDESTTTQDSSNGPLAEAVASTTEVVEIEASEHAPVEVSAVEEPVQDTTSPEVTNHAVTETAVSSHIETESPDVSPERAIRTTMSPEAEQSGEEWETEESSRESTPSPVRVEQDFTEERAASFAAEGGGYPAAHGDHTNTPTEFQNGNGAGDEVSSPELANVAGNLQNTVEEASEVAVPATERAAVEEESADIQTYEDPVGHQQDIRSEVPATAMEDREEASDESDEWVSESEQGDGPEECSGETQESKDKGQEHTEKPESKSPENKDTAVVPPSLGFNSSYLSSFLARTRASRSKKSEEPKAVASTSTTETSAPTPTAVTRTPSPTPAPPKEDKDENIVTLPDLKMAQPGSSGLLTTPPTPPVRRGRSSRVESKIPRTSLAPRPPITGSPKWDTMLERDRKKLVAKNTEANVQPPPVPHKHQIIRKNNARPPSPTPELQSKLAATQRHRRKLHFERTGIELGPGETPEEARARVKGGYSNKAAKGKEPMKKEEVKETKIKWGAPLEQEVETELPKKSPSTAKTKVPTKGAVRRRTLDKWGNVVKPAEETEPPANSPVVIKKILYKGE